jgi:D-arabinose 1-dehydrogenase-like Zn-dependent alcohol dehydrogenase
MLQHSTSLNAYVFQIRPIVTTGSKIVKVWKKFKLDNVKEAIQALSSKERNGRILLDIT